MVGVHGIEPIFWKCVKYFVCIKLIFLHSFFLYLFQCIGDHESNFKKEGSIPCGFNTMGTQNYIYSFSNMQFYFEICCNIVYKNKIKQGSIILKCDLKINRFLLFMYIYFSFFNLHICTLLIYLSSEYIVFFLV